MERIINNHLVYTELPKTGEEQIAAAIKRLSEWASQHYPVVDLYNDGKFNMLACYRDYPEGETKYAIGAVWRPGSNEYTFHS